MAITFFCSVWDQRPGIVSQSTRILCDRCPCGCEEIGNFLVLMAFDLFQSALLPLMNRHSKYLQGNWWEWCKIRAWFEKFGFRNWAPSSDCTLIVLYGQRIHVQKFLELNVDRENRTWRSILFSSKWTFVASPLLKITGHAILKRLDSRP